MEQQTTNFEYQLNTSYTVSTILDFWGMINYSTNARQKDRRLTNREVCKMKRMLSEGCTNDDITS